MTKSIKKSTSTVQNPKEKIQAKQNDKSITLKFSDFALMTCAVMVAFQLNFRMIQSKPKRE
jgi:hypothetical protein